MARKTTCMTETSVTKYISARTDGTEEKGPAMPRLKAPCGHREIPVSYTHLTLPTTPYV